MIRFSRTWLVPLLCSVAAFVAGYIAFHPAWKQAAPLTDGSAASFTDAVRKIDEQHLLMNASPQERVRWLLEICRQRDGGLARDHALYEAIQQMQPGDFLAALADLPAFGREMVETKDDVRAVLIEAGLERWLDVDKNGALRWLGLGRQIVESNALALPLMDKGDHNAMYGVLVTRAPEWLHEQVDKLGEKTGRETALSRLMFAEAKRDPAQAQKWLESFRGTKDWDAAFTAYVTSLSMSDPRAAMEMALSAKPKETPLTENRVAVNVFLSTAARSPALAAELLAPMEPKMRQRLAPWALVYVEQNGGDPFAWLADRIAGDPGLLDGAGNAKGNPELMWRALVVRDPERTLEFIDTLPEGQRAASREDALLSWSANQADTFLDWLSTQPPEGLPKNFKSIEAAALREPDRFATWVATLPPGDLRERSQLTLAKELAKQGRVAEALAQFPPSSTVEGVSEGARAIGSAIASREPAAAAQWVTSLPAGASQTEAARGLVSAWSGQAPDAAAEWVKALPPGPLRDAATGSLASTFARADPEAATAWIEQISDAKARSTAAQQVFRAWAQTDPVSARDWLRGFPGVSDVSKTRLLGGRP